MKTLIKMLKTKYPDVEYVASEEPELTDDEIYVNENISLQVVNSNHFGIHAEYALPDGSLPVKYVSKVELLKILLDD